MNLELCRELAPKVLAAWVEGGSLGEACEAVGQSANWADHWFAESRVHPDYAWLAPLIADAERQRAEREAARRMAVVREVCRLLEAGEVFQRAEEAVGVSRGRVRGWAKTDPTIAARLAAAQEAGRERRTARERERLRRQGRAHAEVLRATGVIDRPVTKEPQPHVVYIIAATGTNRVKIGYTGHGAAARLAQLQTASPVELRLYASFVATRAVEKLLHARFAACRAHREWFDATPDLLAFASAFNGRSVTADDVNGWLAARVSMLPLRLAV